MGQMFFGAEFPNKSGDFHVVTNKFLEHCAGIYLQQSKIANINNT